MKTELKRIIKGTGLMLSHMKFSESDFATVIDINVIKYNDEAWHLAMLMNACRFTYDLGLSKTHDGAIKCAEFLFEHEANKEILALIRESENL